MMRALALLLLTGCPARSPTPPSTPSTPDDPSEETAMLDLAPAIELMTRETLTATAAEKALSRLSAPLDQARLVAPAEGQPPELLFVPVPPGLSLARLVESHGAARESPPMDDGPTESVIRTDPHPDRAFTAALVIRHRGDQVVELVVRRDPRLQ